jgi:hypothetical protein
MEDIQAQKGIAFMKSVLSTVSLILLIQGCSLVGTSDKVNIVQENPKPHIKQLLIDPHLEQQLLTLNPEKITEKDINEVLSHLPAPRIVNLNGSLSIVTMDSFSKFLIRMGYPESSIRDPITGAYSYSSYLSSKKLAGWLAWYYENEGMMPIIIGHSQGGMRVIKVLHELAGEFNDNLYVWNPYTGKKENRYTIIDPLTGAKRPVKGLRVGFASAIATGRLMRFFLFQWDMIGKLRKIPDTVEEFTGFYIPFDIIGSDLLGFGNLNKYYPSGSTKVQNILLPAGYSHFTIIHTEHLAINKATRQWINEFNPSESKVKPPPEPNTDTRNILFAANIWYKIKKYWCIELQRLIRAQRNIKIYTPLSPD